MSSKDNKKGIWQSFFHLMYGVRVYYGAIGLAIGGLIITRLAEASIYKYLIPQTLDEGFIAHKPDFLQHMPILFIGIFLAIGLGEFLSKYYMGFVGRSVVSDNRKRMLNHLLTVPMAYYKKHTVGELISKINYDSEQVATAVSDSVRELLNSLIAIIVLFAAMLSISCKVTLVIMCVAPVISIVLRKLGKRMRRYSTRVQHSMGELTHVTSEVIVGHQVIRIYQGNAYESLRIKDATENNLRQELKTFFLAAISAPIMQIIGGTVLVGFLYFVMMDSINLPPGQIMGLIGVMFALIRPLKQISGVNNVLQKGIAASESIQLLLQTPAEFDSGTNTLSVRPQELAFVNVDFAYPDAPDVPILSNISFSAKCGQTVALVGGSGSGKSSLMSLVPRFYQTTNGAITIDGQNINSINLLSLRSQIALITQNVILFNDSVAKNIAYGVADANIQMVRHAAKVANALGFIEALPQGFDTIIGENGCLLSGGQRQRLAIARAIFKDAAILIMDEATSALDTESELAIKIALQNLMCDRITLIIAHRLSTIEKADKILVLDHGRIIESGTHQELLDLQGRYAQLQQAQLIQDVAVES